ncbi:Carboxylesterase NlhH [Corynebacterium provencense]|uniref:Carboxylesterase NlhH n=1 Tax=Corynebacterium provencense TaxID=1737425 RepID=A0A2Z3YWD1_9CORY|nr:alpha/beta hydrolase fold domain-containing protein [Corynebacterium provencense]AWT26357.1 Carboxylesterase NlhH [Corynebacterium provencense]
MTVATPHVLVHRADPARGLLIWVHGGSWRSGSAAAWSPMTAELADRSGWTVLSVDYRLAPEHPYPAAVGDVLAVLDRFALQDSTLPVALGGDSAGATVTLLAALQRRDTPVLLLLAYPPLDPECEAASYREPGAAVFTAQLRQSWRLWLRPSSLPSLEDLKGLGPVTLVVGERDPVRDDATALADRLRRSGVPTDLHVLPGIGHADILNPGSRTLTTLVNTLTSPERTSS